MKNIAKKYSKRQPKIKAEMSGKGLTVHAGLLPVLNFMGKLMFRERVHEAVHKDRGANARLLSPTINEPGILRLSGINILR
ncbi:hypothetical protein KSMBR1_2682 [Candidatus Kuenenia stuttgartiensis]|uniref:Uncharacterized protein n=1 Tax=Kuenenia stuttgartiensis TaxID=174633 RepID=A0A2C9CGY4_KUEST|nr:hypothetical protein KSMBR1_2682 [Candidatus Kuenenia stuttgartiensis]